MSTRLHTNAAAYSLASTCLVATVCILVVGCTSSTRTRAGMDGTRNGDETGDGLAGKIWDTRAGRSIGEDELVERLLRARYVLLGERHDNPEHHRLQARLLEAMIEAGRRPTLALEMLDPADDAIVARYLSDARRSTAALAAELGWTERAWPAWEIVRPAVDVAVDHLLPIVSANLSAELLGKLRKGALDPAISHRLGLDRPLPAGVFEAMADEIRQAHCGHASDAMVDAMVMMQRARDEVMARSMIDGDRGNGTVLLAGAGHVRTDRGVPMHLARLAPGAPTVAVGLLEVAPGARSPGQAAADTDSAEVPFDFAWFTPEIERPDPCVEFEKQLERLGAPAVHRDGG